MRSWLISLNFRVMCPLHHEPAVPGIHGFVTHAPTSPCALGAGRRQHAEGTRHVCALHQPRGGPVAPEQVRVCSLSRNGHEGWFPQTLLCAAAFFSLPAACFSTYSDTEGLTQDFANIISYSITDAITSFMSSFGHAGKLSHLVFFLLFFCF